MKKIIVIILFVFAGTFAFSQTDIAFDYDANGNRTVRRILDMGKKNLESADTTDYNEEVLEKKLAFNENIGDTQITYFPNPVKEWLNIKVNGSEDWEIGDYSLFNNVGKLLDKGQLSSDNRLDFKDYSPGLYLLEIKIDENKQVWKILKD